MSGRGPVDLASTRRGDVDEALIRGHAALVDASGAVLAGAGDPAAMTTLRSCVKPLQALPFVRDAVDHLGVSDAELAIACASHNGEPVHVETVLRLLDRVGRDASALSCGPQPPLDAAAWQTLAGHGEAPSPLHNNCSGKHAAMVACCVVRGWPVEGYAAAGHPLQREIRHLMSEAGGTDLETAPSGIDGCGLVTHGVPLAVLARMFAAASVDPGFRRCQDAMAAQPYLVAGRGQFDTALLATSGLTLTVKVGAAAVWVAVLRPAGPALAIKLEAGDGAAMPAIALAALEALGWVDGEAVADPRLAGFRHPVLRNWNDDVVGAINVAPGWAQRLAG